MYVVECEQAAERSVGRRGLVAAAGVDRAHHLAHWHVHQDDAGELCTAACQGTGRHVHRPTFVKKDAVNFLFFFFFQTQAKLKFERWFVC